MLKLSPGQAGDAPQGRELLEAGGPAPAGCKLLTDTAYEGDETRALAKELGYEQVVPPHPIRSTPWEYDRAAYRRRNEIERLFGRLKLSRQCRRECVHLPPRALAQCLLANNHEPTPCHHGRQGRQ